MTDIERIGSVVRIEPRASTAHKGDFGRVLVVGGSGGMIGAVALAANAALRGGAGLVTFAAPATIQQTIAGLCPCATSVALGCDSKGHLAHRAVRQVLQSAGECDVIAVGPGMGVGAIQQNIVRAAIELGKTLVIDADGLNNLTRIPRWPSLRKGPMVIMPHPGEFARLTGLSVSNIQADREGSALRQAREWADQVTLESTPLVVVLKGAGTVVTDSRRLYVNNTGNPGMASGGSGDVLTGLIAALLAQGLENFQAACLGVWAHGRAGDFAAQHVGQVSLVATDLLDHLPLALREQGG